MSDRAGDRIACAVIGAGVVGLAVALAPAYAGIRPKLSGPGDPPADFVIAGLADHGVSGLINLFGIDSPGLTSSLAIAEHVAALAGASDRSTVVATGH